MVYYRFDEDKFRNSVLRAMESVRRVLEVDRAPSIRLAEDVDHKYTDKYQLANLLTNTSIVAYMAVLEQLGVTKKVLQSLGEDRSKETTLRFAARESCTLVKEEIVDEPLFTKETEVVTTESKEQSDVVFDVEGNETRSRKTTIEKIMKRLKKETFCIEVEWSLSVYSGTDVENGTVILKRASSSQYVRSHPYDATEDDSRKRKYPPFPPITERGPRELSLTWLLQQIDTNELKSHFSIDESNPKTKTPTRNGQMEQALLFFQSVSSWAVFVANVTGYFRKFGDYKETASNFANQIFVPVIPLMVDPTMQMMKPQDVEIKSNAMISLSTTNDMSIDGDSQGSLSAMLSVADITRFLKEQARSLLEFNATLQSEHADKEVTTNIYSSEEARLLGLSMYTGKLASQFQEGIYFIESMLEKQLVTAIGKRVSSADLDKFMKYHNEKFLNPCPKPFCYSIRRPEHYPDGILSIEQSLDHGDKSEMESISTHVREVTSIEPIKVPLNSVTTLALTGKTYLHGWLNHCFGNTSSDGSTRLNARARQFSSFVLLVGTMTNKNHMQPKDAIILRNTDEIHIPLLLNLIPTAREFKDAIGSLSPEQQRFAKSFRSMQLESSVLGVSIVQIKPQLENLLGLPEDSLTKEIKLTEDLVELFVEYQVPSDLLSCDSCIEADGKTRVENVRKHVTSVLEVIAAQKSEQLEAQKQKTEMEKLKRVERKKANDPIARQMMCGASRRASRPLRMRMSASHVGRVSNLCESMDLYGCSSTVGEPFDTSIQSTSIENNSGIDSLQNNHTMETEAATETNQSCPSNQNALVFASIPKILDAAIEKHDRNAALRSTTIKTSDTNWTRSRKENLLSKTPKTIRLTEDQIASEKQKAFDLLDALSRSGSLEVPFSELHVLICATLSFEKSVMETVIQDNINPIEKLEMSTLLMGSTVLDTPAYNLIGSETNRKRLKGSYPQLVCRPDDSIETSSKMDDNLELEDC